jgi:hypothetical protein
MSPATAPANVPPALTKQQSHQMQNEQPSNETVRLYRGIAVALDARDEVIESIKLRGLVPDERTSWKGEMPDPKQVRMRTDELFNDPASIRSAIDSMPGQPLICACGDIYGASYYATHHNITKDKTASILIEFEAPLDSLCVDGRDFLCQAFQFWDSTGEKDFFTVGMHLASCFGPQIFTYFQAAASGKDQMARIGICDLACHDLEVLKAHSENDVLIRGRFSTQFCSAFMLQLPIPASAILRIDPFPKMPSPPDGVITLQDIR